MAKVSNTSGSSNIWLGSKGNTRQTILYVPADTTAGSGSTDKPGLLFLESIASAGGASNLGGVYLWATDSDTLRYSATYPTDQAADGSLVAGDTDVKVGIDAAATAGYLGAAVDDGVLRFTTNEFTLADGGDYVTLSLADHNTARTALGLAIGTDVQAYDAGLTNLAAVSMAANQYYYTSADNTHVAAGITANGRSFVAAANYAAQMALWTGQCGASFSWNSQALTSVGAIGCASVTATGALADGSASTFTTGAAIGNVTIANGSITDSSGAISFGNENLTTQGDIHLDLDDAELQLGNETTDSSIKFNGTSLVLTDTDAGSYTLQELAATGGISPTVAGDLTLSDGSLTITDGDNASTFTLINNTITDGAALVDISSTSITSEAVLHLDADAITTGAFVQCDRGGTQFSVKRYGEIEIAGLTDSDMITITAGNFLMSDGTVNVTDADNNTLVTLVNDAITTGGNLIDINADAITSGNFIHLDTDQATSFTGKFIDCVADGTNTVFGIDDKGQVTIAGTARGTAAVTLTLGDLVLSDGWMNIDSGNTDGGHNIASSANATNNTPLLTLTQSDAAYDQAVLQVTAAANGDVNTVQITNAGTGYGISETLSLATGEGLEIIFATGGTQNGIFLDANTGTYVGASGTGMLHLHQTGTLAQADATAIFVNADGTYANNGQGGCLLIDDDMTAAGSNVAVSINSLAACPLKVETQATGMNTLIVEATAAQTVSSVVIDCATNDWDGADNVGALQIDGNTALADAGATMLMVRNTGGAAPINNATGHLARFEDLSNAGGGTQEYAVEIYSDNNAALNVSKGFARFTTGIIFSGNSYDVTDLAAPPTNANCITMFGAAGNQGAMYLYDDNDAGTSVYIIIDDGGDYHYITSTQAA